MAGPLNGIGLDDLGPGLVAKQIHGVCSVMPQQAVGPGTRFAQRIDIGAAKEIGLYVQLLNFELATGNALVYPLMGWIESPGMPDHTHQPGLLLQFGHGLGIRPAVRQRNLYLHVLAGLQALERLRGVHLSGRAQDCRHHTWPGEGLRQAGGGVRDTAACRKGFGSCRLSTDYRYHLDSADLPEGIEVFASKGAGSREHNLHVSLSKIRWPSAVFDTGTW